jgi:hypothetical protein
MIIMVPEERIKTGLTSRRMWWWMWPTLCLTRAKEEATTKMTIMGARGNMDNVIGMAAVLYISKEEDGGSLIVTVPEGRTTIGLTMKRSWWWMLIMRRMW